MAAITRRRGAGQQMPGNLGSGGGEQGGEESINMSHHHRTLATLPTIGLTPAAGSAKFYCLGSTLVGQ